MFVSPARTDERLRCRSGGRLLWAKRTMY